MKKKPKLSPTAYFRLVDVSTAIFLAAVAAAFFARGNFVYASVLSIIFFALLLYLVWRGPADEFAASCWHSATSTTFLTMVGLTVILPYVVGFTEGMVEGFTDAHIGTPPPGARITPVEFPYLHLNEDMVAPISIAVFLTTFQWHRWRASR